MDNKMLQTALKAAGLYKGGIDGDVGEGTTDAINAFLLHGGVDGDEWAPPRRLLAAQQLVCREAGIEIGAIDGLMGPQTDFAFDVFAEKQGGPSTSIPDRDVDPPQAEPAGAKPTWPRQADVENFYGPVGKHQTKLALPFPMRIAWDLSKSVNSITLHEKVHDSADRCFRAIAKTYTNEQRRELGLDLFGGSLNVRKMRGGSRWSMHSWGIAIDFDPARNTLKANHTKARLAQPDCAPFWEIWEAEGWVSLGRVRDFDWMHVQAARL